MTENQCKHEHTEEFEKVYWRFVEIGVRCKDCGEIIDSRFER